jgi:hypothetical protein
MAMAPPAARIAVLAEQPFRGACIDLSCIPIRAERHADPGRRTPGSAALAFIAGMHVSSFADFKAGDGTSHARG